MNIHTKKPPLETNKTAMPHYKLRKRAIVGFSFTCQANCSHTKARAGVFHTPHGIVETPRFMPVGTLATVKGVIPQQLEAANSQMILANTYHLHLQPGEDIIQEAGGLHRFMAWDKPILTDSGGRSYLQVSP
jgi:queuine tRNA-ribosyltransferase